jgi:hypothetical protein
MFRGGILSPTILIALQAPASTFFHTIPSQRLHAIELHYDAQLDPSRKRERRKLLCHPSLEMYASMNTVIVHLAVPRFHICLEHLLELPAHL